jgi:hypothetical protein
VTDSACLDFDADLAASRLGDGALDDFEITAWLADLNGFHMKTSLGWIKAVKEK